MIPYYTFKEIGQQLKEMILNKNTQEQIGSWASCVYNYSYIINENDNINTVLMHLSAMEDGPEFYYSYEELERIADALIEGKEVKI